MERRRYQDKAVAELPERLRRHGRVVAVGPTGSGKTVIAVKLIRKLLHDHHGLRVLWLVHRIELVRQAYDQLKAAGIPASAIGILSGATKLNTTARILVASVDMFRTRDVPPCDLMVIDEAHRVLAATYKQIVEYSEKRWLLGLTATPWRLDGKGLGDVFSDMLVMAGHTELIVDGYIAKPVTYGIPRDKARRILRGLRISHGDYAQADLQRLGRNKVLMGDVVRDTQKYAPGAATLVFAMTREHGKALTARFKRAGISAEYLDGDTPDAERDAMIGPNGRLARGETQVVVNVDVLTEGYDCPAVKCVCLARPTRSLTRFLQQCGRGSRMYKRQRPVILDHFGNCYAHGLPDDERSDKWTLEDRPKRTGGGEIVKQCVACEAMIAANARECPECGAEQPLSEREIEEQQAELERLKSTAQQRRKTLDVLRSIANEKGVGESWVRAVESRVFGIA